MQNTTLAIPQELYEKLRKEAQRHRLEVTEVIQILLEGKVPQKSGRINARFLHELLAIAPKFRGPKDLSSKYEQMLYGSNPS